MQPRLHFLIIPVVFSGEDGGTRSAMLPTSAEVWEKFWFAAEGGIILFRCSSLGERERLACKYWPSCGLLPDSDTWSTLHGL